MIKKYSSFILLTSLFFSCHSTKKSTVTKANPVEEPSITLDTVNVVFGEPEKRKPYQATNTKSNDVIHTKLWVSFDWQKSQLIGKAELEVKPYFYATNMLYLDARGMEIKTVTLFEKSNLKLLLENKNKITGISINYSEIPSTFVYKNDSIKLNLGRLFNADEHYKVVVEYIAKPNDLKKGGSEAISDDKGLYFINPLSADSNKMPQIWTQGETQSNSAWFPCIDNPTEKMTNEIYMTVEDKYTTLSNGLLKDSKKNTDGTRTDHWMMDMPHASYLVMMAVGEFKKVTDEPWNGKEISYYVEKEYEPHAKAIFGKTKQMIDFYSKRLGVPYPWQKYAQIVCKDYVSGAMENTTATLHGDFMVYQTTREIIDGAKGESVIAHELFHQWFGDYASCESWSNLTLNESFATYGEYLWEEFANGRDAADDHSASSRKGYLASAMQNDANLVRFDYEGREEMFDAISYNKGGQILHMLRKYVGDDAFFASLKLYLETHRFKTAEAHELRLAFEEVTGEDLNWFFNQWYFAAGYPKLSVKQSFDETTKKITLTINQTQDLKNTPLYKMPIEVDVYSNGAKVRQRIWIKDEKNTYTFDASIKPELVNVDAERQLLAEIDYEKTTAEYIYQYNQAKLWGDRNEAIDYFVKNTDKPEVYEMLKGIATKDPWKYFRKEAIEVLSLKTKEELKSLFITIYKTDANTTVRATALKALAKNYDGADLNALYESALTEQSYYIVSAGLKALTERNTTLAILNAAKFEKEESSELHFAIMELYANHGLDDKQAYFKNVRSKFSGYDLMGYANFYGKFLKRQDKPEVAIEGAKDLVSIANTDNKYIKYTALKSLKDNLVKTWQEKEATLIKNTATTNDATNIELQKTTDIKNKLIELYNSAIK